jgi:hypothetical protein
MREIGGRKNTKFCKKCQKTDRKTFLQLSRSKSIELFAVAWQKIYNFCLVALKWSVYKLPPKFFLTF